MSTVTATRRAGRAATTTIRAHRLVHDHGLQGREAKQTSEQGKPELSAIETDQATEESGLAPVARAAESDLALAGAATALVDGSITATR